MNKPTTRSIRAYNVAQYLRHKGRLQDCIARNKLMAANKAQKDVDYWRSLALDVKGGAASAFPMMDNRSILLNQIKGDTHILYGVRCNDQVH